MEKFKQNTLRQAQLYTLQKFSLCYGKKVIKK